MTDSIAAQVAALPKTPTPELKAMWRELYGKEPPGFSRSYLISRLVELTEMPVHRVLASISRLEAKGSVVRVSGALVRRA